MDICKAKIIVFSRRDFVCKCFDVCLAVANRVLYAGGLFSCIQFKCLHTQKQTLLNTFCINKLGYLSPQNLHNCRTQFLSAIRSIRFVSSAFRSTEFSEVNTMQYFVYVIVSTKPNVTLSKFKERCRSVSLLVLVSRLHITVGGYWLVFLLLLPSVCLQILNY